jgi:hypothetical protein
LKTLSTGRVTGPTLRQGTGGRVTGTVTEVMGNMPKELTGLAGVQLFIERPLCPA